MANGSKSARRPARTPARSIHLARPDGARICRVLTARPCWCHCAHRPCRETHGPIKRRMHSNTTTRWPGIGKRESQTRSLGLSSTASHSGSNWLPCPTSVWRVKTGAYYRMGAIFSQTPVATRFAQQAGRIGQRRQVFANGLWLVAVGLEFQRHLIHAARRAGGLASSEVSGVHICTL